MFKRHCVQIGPQAPSIERAAAMDLATYLSQVLGDEVPLLSRHNAPEHAEGQVVLLVGTPDTNPCIKELCEKGTLEGSDLSIRIADILPTSVFSASRISSGALRA